MPLTKLNTFTKKVADLADKPNATMTAAQVKAQFDAAPDEVRQSLNAVIDQLQSIVDGDSGADNIKLTAIPDLTGSSVQSALESLRNSLKSAIDGASGADFINSTSITGVTGTTVQSQLESLKTLIDAVYTKYQLDSGQLDNRYFTETELQSVTDGNSGADKVKATPISTSPSTVQGILEWLKSQIDATVLGQIPDGSIPDAKLSGEATEIKQRFSEHQAEEVSQGEVHGLRATNGKLEYFDGTEWKTVSGGLPVGSVSNFVATSGNAQATLTWADPVDVVLNDATIAAWAGTKILRKTGSYPVNEKDGVLVVDSAIRDQYATNGFVDNGLTNDTAYFYSAFPYTDEDIFDKKSDAQATPRAVQIYGVKIDTTNSNPATAVTYTDGAIGFTPASGNNGAFNFGSWQDKFPFNQIKPCVLKSDLTVNYYLNPDDYTKKLDGTSADITTGTDGDVMVEFPKLWWKFETVGTDLYVRYADAQVDATWKCLAHQRGVTEKDKVYVSAYLGYNLSSKLRSLSGKTPTATQTIGTFRTQAQANGPGFDQMAYFQILMLQVLFIVMFKSRDSQTSLGRGYVDGNASAIATGGTNAKGMFYGETTGTQQNKFCGIEDFWGNLYYWIDGFYSDANYNLLIGTQNFNDTGSGYANYGQGATANLSGYISDVQGETETGFVIKASAGSTSTYYADNGALYASQLPAFGGLWANTDAAGAFRLNVTSSASSSDSAIGARLLAL